MNNKYPFQLWLTSIAIAPLLFVIIGFASSSGGESGDFIALLFFIVFGLVYSLPVFLFCFIAFKYLRGKPRSSILIKIILNIIAIIGVFITFLIISGRDAFNWHGNRSGLIFRLIYSVSIIISSTFYKIPEQRKDVV